MSERLTGPPLQQQVRARLDPLFPSELRKRAAATLEKRGGYSVFGVDNPGLDERIVRLRLACLKLSGGTLEGLEEALRMARGDWRALLEAADAEPESEG